MEKEKKEIWFRKVTTEMANERGLGTMFEHVAVKITEIGPDYVVARMPVDHRTKQPYGILHGGASVVLAEGVASFAGNFCIDNKTHQAVGLEVNANHIRPVRDGWVEATARPQHIGRTTQVWEIILRDSKGKLSCICRLTLAIIEKTKT